MTSYPEVIGVYIENLAVELAQVRVGRLDVVQIIHRFVQSIQHHLAMRSDLGVALDGSNTV